MPLRPEEFARETEQELVENINRHAIGLYRTITRAMPVGVGGNLQSSWNMSPATPARPVASVGTSSSYFLPVEMGRKPGKGISEEGQESVQLWAKRVLGMEPKEAKGFSYLLSQKYKREGRPAMGLLGLTTPGTKGDPVPSDYSSLPPGLLKTALDNLTKELR